VRADGRILRHAADEEAGIAAGLAEQKGRQRGRRGLAVRAADDEVAATPEHEIVQERGQRRVRQGARIEQPFDLGVAACHDVADDDQVGCELHEPGRIVALVQRDAGGSEDGAHGRVDTGVGPEHVVPGGARQQRRVAHRRAADAHEVA
jgi:hypothetical protein